MTSAPQAPGGRRIRVRSIRYALLARFAALIVFAFAVFCAGLYVLIVKPTREEIATAELLRATALVESEFKSLVAQAERVLRTASEWGKGGHFDLFDVSTFNRLFMPLLATRPLVSSVFVADGTGRMLMLDTKSEGEWRNRVGDIARRGKVRCTLRWRDAATFLGEECAEGDYDPRQRPWHIGAMSLARDSDVYWTDPYVFFASQQPGITASMKWRGAADDQPNVVAFDIELLNLSRFITTLSVGRNGRLALLTNDGKIVGATAPSSSSDADIKRMVLKPPDKSGFPHVAAALEKWEAEARPYDKVSRFRSEGEDWLARFHSAPFGNGHFIIAVVAPESDFLPEALRRAAGVFAGLLAAVIAVGLASAALMARGFSAPLEALARASRSLSRMKLDEPITTASQLQEVQALVEAQERMRVALQDSIAALERSNRELEDRVEERTRELAEREAYFRAIFENTGAGIVSRGADRRLINANQAYLDFTGYTREELETLDPAALMRDEDRKPVRENMERMERGETSIYRLERQYRQKGRRPALGGRGHHGDPRRAGAAHGEHHDRQRHHRAQADGGRAAPGARSRRGSDQDEVHVPRQHEPRDPHADERHHRHVAPRAEDRLEREAARLRPEDPQRGHGAARHHQRHPRLLQDRGRQAHPGDDGLRPRGGAVERLDRGRRRRCSTRGWSCCSTWIPASRGGLSAIRCASARSSPTS